ncbi:MAG: HEAT repeat domain-containing protein [Candidatus Kariarchaeaceae archaeon]
MDFHDSSTDKNVWKIDDLTIRVDLDPDNNLEITIEQLDREKVTLRSEQITRILAVFREINNRITKESDMKMTVPGLQEEIINELETYYTQLYDDNDEKRVIAAIALGLVKEREAIDRLSDQLLADPSPKVRRQCAISLGLIGDKHASPVLVRSMKEDENPAVREVSVMSLSKLKGDGVQCLGIQLLEETNPRVRKTIAHNLGKIGDIHSVIALMSASLNDTEEEVRERASSSLRELNSKLGFPSIEDLLQAVPDCSLLPKNVSTSELFDFCVINIANDDVELRSTCVTELGWIGNTDVVPLLKERIDDEKETAVKVRIIISLGELSGEGFQSELIEMLFNNENQYIRRAASVALGRIGTQDALVALKRVIIEEPSGIVRASALGGIMNQFDTGLSKESFTDLIANKN